MMSKVALFLCMLSVGSWGAFATSAKRLHGPSVSNTEYSNYYSAAPQYDFNYGVSDLSGGASYGASESRRGARTTGSYFVDVPGSQTQKVSYVVGGKSGYKLYVPYQQKKYLPKLEKVGYKTRNAYFPKAKGVSYTKSINKHPYPAFKAYSPTPKVSYSPKREISHSGFPVSHSQIRNYHTKPHPTSYTKSSFFYPKTAVSYSKSKIYHPKPSYSTVYKAHPTELRADSLESNSKKAVSHQNMGATISKLPATELTYQPILIKTYKPVYEVKYKPVFKRDYRP